MEQGGANDYGRFDFPIWGDGPQDLIITNRGRRGNQSAPFLCRTGDAASDAPCHHGVARRIGRCSTPSGEIGACCAGSGHLIALTWADQRRASRRPGATKRWARSHPPSRRDHADAHVLSYASPTPTKVKRRQQVVSAESDAIFGSTRIVGTALVNSFQRYDIHISPAGMENWQWWSEFCHRAR